jgi:spore maturation protein CgeB
MRLVIFGLTISSSWGNGHATLWRGLCQALHARDHHVTFFERDVPYYAEHRDLRSLHGGELVLYDDWFRVTARAIAALEQADVALVTSYCPDGRAASDLVLASSCVRGFYDLDTPVTLARLAAGDEIPYLPIAGLGGFDLVLSYTGGRALDELRDRLGARRVEALYGSVDPDRYQRGCRQPHFEATLSYLGTYAADRQAMLQRLFMEPAQRRAADRFLIGGSQYPPEFSWLTNVYYVRHVPPADHPDFYASSRFTLNVTRAAMAQMGFCPSGRLFEAAACEAAILSDVWPGFETFFDPSSEVCIVGNADEVIEALSMSDAARRRLGEAARARVLAAHTAAHRVETLERLLAGVTARPAATA